MSKAPVFGAFGIGFAHFGVIGEAKVVVEAPYDHLFAAKLHSASDFSFQRWECKVPVCYLGVLAQRAAIVFEFFKKILHVNNLKSDCD